MKMKAEPGSWWKKIKQHPFIAEGIAVLGSFWKQIQKYRRAIGVVAIVLTVIIVLIIAGYWLNWTGFNGYDKVTKEFTPGGQLVKTTSEYQPGKTLWDWLQLLIIPVVLAVAGFLLNQLQKDRDQKAEDAQKQREENAAKEREKIERESREDNQCETALQAYINNMSELLLEKHLVELTEDDTLTSEEKQVREIARVRTLTVLQQLLISAKGS